MNDQKTIRLVLAILGVVVVLVIVGAIALTFDGKGLPDALIALAGLALGAVAGMLSQTNTNQTQPVTVVNPPADPVNVAEAGHVDLTTIATVCLIVITVVALLFAFNQLPLN